MNNKNLLIGGGILAAVVIFLYLRNNSQQQQEEELDLDDDAIKEDESVIDRANLNNIVPYTDRIDLEGIDLLKNDAKITIADAETYKRYAESVRNASAI